MRTQVEQWMEEAIAIVQPLIKGNVHAVQFSIEDTKIVYVDTDDGDFLVNLRTKEYEVIAPSKPERITECF